jgi:hypothetical protein
MTKADNRAAGRAYAAEKSASSKRSGIAQAAQPIWKRCACSATV